MLRLMEGLSPLQLYFFPSAMLTLILATQSALVVIALHQFPLPIELHTALGLATVTYSARLHWRSNQPASRFRVTSLQLVAGKWVAEAGGKRYRVRLESATVWSWLVVMRLRHSESRRRFPLLVFPDSCSAQHWRQLQVLLRHCLVHESGMRID